jgi:hypothetical protein
VNSSGITIHWLASLSFPFSKMSKPNVEPIQLELFHKEYSSQYIKPSTHLHLVPAVKVQRITPLFPFTPLWHAEESLYLIQHTCLVSSAETYRTKGICYRNWHCYCRKATEQAELWKMVAPVPTLPLSKVICTAFLWNIEILRCNVHKQTKYFTLHD